MNNKHLIKIIIEYISITPCYTNGLLDKTKSLLSSINLGNWYYYDKYVVCNEQYRNDTYNFTYEKGYKFHYYKYKYEYRNYDGRWDLNYSLDN